MYGTENIGSITGTDLATLIASAAEANNKCIGALTVSELQDIIAGMTVQSHSHVLRMWAHVAGGDSTEVTSIQSDYANQLKNRKVWRSKINGLSSSMI